MPTLRTCRPYRVELFAEWCLKTKYFPVAVVYMTVEYVACDSYFDIHMLHNVYSVHRGMFRTLWGYHSNTLGCVHYTGVFI